MLRKQELYFDAMRRSTNRRIKKAFVWGRSNTEITVSFAAKGALWRSAGPFGGVGGMVPEIGPPLTKVTYSFARWLHARAYLGFRQAGACNYDNGWAHALYLPTQLATLAMSKVARAVNNTRLHYFDFTDIPRYPKKSSGMHLFLCRLFRIVTIGL